MRGLGSTVPMLLVIIPILEVDGVVNGVDISGATESYYILQDEDKGKTITVRVTHHSVTKDSNGVEIPASPIVAPVVNIEWQNFTGRSSEAVWQILEEIQEAYNENRNGCKTAIDAEDYMPWRINLIESESGRDARIISGKLEIYFSCEYYDGFNQTNKNTRLNQIGTELAYLAGGATIGFEYTGNYENIRMAKFKEPPPPKTG